MYLQDNVMYETYFNVWGMKFCVQFFSEIDKAWIEYILRNYISCKEENTPIKIIIPNNGEKGYMRNHLNNLDVLDIIIEDIKGCRESWNNVSTPIPPFLLKPYRGKYVLVHGCGVCANNGKKTLIIGDSMTGKTFLSLRLIMENYKLITDDLIIFDYQNSNVLPYSKPIGLREKSLCLDSRLKNYVTDNHNEKLVFTANSGEKTWLVHIDDIFPHSLYRDICFKIDRVIYLNSDVSEIQRYDLGCAIKEIGKSIIESGISPIKIFYFLSNYLKEIPELFVAPIHHGESIARFVMEQDGYV